MKLYNAISATLLTALCTTTIHGNLKLDVSIIQSEGFKTMVLSDPLFAKEASNEIITEAKQLFTKIKEHPLTFTTTPANDKLLQIKQHNLAKEVEKGPAILQKHIEACNSFLEVTRDPSATGKAAIEKHCDKYIATLRNLQTLNMNLQNHIWFVSHHWQQIIDEQNKQTANPEMGSQQQ